MNQGMFEPETELVINTTIDQVGKNFGQSILMKIDANIPATKLEKLYGRIEQKRVGKEEGLQNSNSYWLTGR